MVDAVRRAGWRDVRLEGRELQIPSGMVLDLGATAKAWAADRCAAVVADRLGCGVLVSLGGDLSVAGPDPDGGWTILVQDGPAEPASTISLDSARAVATSSILGRSWRVWNQRMHHILDPVTCRPATEVWRTASVAAESCVTANVLATAAMVRGRRAPDLLRAWGTPARLVAADGSVIRLNGWPVP
jgi:thiamine biosynthesis lipoprotein